MRAILQRVSRARVTAGGRTTGEIGAGLLVLLGVRKGDGEAEAEYLAGRVAGLRIFSDPEGKMNLSLLDTGGAMLVVSQFTLYGDTRKGRRPGFDDAAPPETARRLYEHFVAKARERGIQVETGEFQAIMTVELANEGPVTFIVESKNG
ncbi:MAG: D-tyrosyl-tRNA(Tyr) deacylase [Bryobacteraceae bacterium]|nr:D-tyrosyl-tRNA(Tyr) deacylase [Bryobacteraceae bacterium]